MTNREFDHVLRSKIAGMSAPNESAGWDTFRHKLHTEQQSLPESAMVFDDLVREKVVKQHQAGLQGNWFAFLSRFHLILRRERQLMTAKVLEFISVILLLLVINKDFVLVHISTDACCMPGSVSVTEQPGLEPGLVAASEVSSVAELVSAAAQEIKVQPKEQELFSEASPLETAFLPGVNTTAIKMTSLNSVPVSTDKGMVSTEVSPLPTTAFREFSLPKRQPAGSITRYKPRPFITLSMLGSTDINRIMTPVTKENDDIIPSSDRLVLGYSGGFNIGIGRGRIALESGLIYTAKQYQARPVIYVTGNTTDGFHGEGLTDMEMNMVSIPVQVKYDVVSRFLWNVYGVAGTSLMVSLENNYAIADQDAFISSQFNPAPGGNQGPVTKSTALQNRNFTGGLLQGGSFRDNSFVTLNLGIGLERKFLDGWSWFVQPAYQHSVVYFSRGLGPEQDRIHTFSVFSGIKLRL
jgi:hypothetical protein